MTRQGRDEPDTPEGGTCPQPGTAITDVGVPAVGHANVADARPGVPPEGPAPRPAFAKAAPPHGPAGGATPYASGEELLADELARVDLRLKAYLLRQRSASLVRSRVESASDGVEFPAACRAVLGHEFRWSDPVVDESCRHEIDRLTGRWQAADAAVAARLRATPDGQRTRMRVWRLTRRLGLVPNLAESVPPPAPDSPASAPPRDTLGLDVLLLALLADRSPRYRAALADAPADDGTAPGGLTPETALQIAQGEADPRRLRWDVFGPASPLVSRLLLDFGGGDATPTPRGVFRIDERAADFLMGRDDLDPALRPFCRLVRGRYEYARLWLDDETKAGLRRLSDLWWQHRGRAAGPGPGAPAWPEVLVVMMHGPAGSPFLQAVQAFMTRGVNVSVPVLAVDVPKALAAPGRWEALAGRCFREASLRGVPVLWQGWEALTAADEAAGKAGAVIALAEQADFPTFLAGTAAWDPEDAFRAPSRSFARVELRLPPEATRRALWKDRLAGLGHAAALDDTLGRRACLDTLGSFLFTEGQVDDALATARGLRLTSTAADPLPAEDHLFEGCRRVSSRRLVSFAQRVPPKPGFDRLDRITLPPDTAQQLEELSRAMRHLNDVHHRLGFEQRLSLGRGLVVLFSGPSGTGKTLAATTLAGVNRKDLYKVDTAAVVSKYIGETEKNLNRVFGDAQDANAVLFFDEADALFGKRGEVEQAQDRWANLEVNFLLQRIEEYTGTVILATNFRQNIDDAFQRRVQVLVNFPLPTAAERLTILRGMFPAAASGAARVEAPAEGELKEVADRFELSGGSLKNVVLDAAFRAVADAPPADPGVVVRLDHVMLGVAREYQKLNKPITAAEFGRDWLGMVTRELKLVRRP